MPPAGYKKRRQAWTHDAIIEKIQEWTDTYGEPPSATEWHPGDCMKSANLSANRAKLWSERAQRFYEGEWPWAGTVFKRFGGWNRALTAAGVEVRWQKRKSTLGTESYGRLDVDDLHKLVDQVEAAMLEGDTERMAIELCRISERASAWVSELWGQK